MKNQSDTLLWGVKTTFEHQQLTFDSQQQINDLLISHGEPYIRRAVELEKNWLRFGFCKNIAYSEYHQNSLGKWTHDHLHLSLTKSKSQRVFDDLTQDPELVKQQHSLESLGWIITYVQMQVDPLQVEQIKYLLHDVEFNQVSGQITNYTNIL
jgi:hypothetical protein